MNKKIEERPARKSHSARMDALEALRKNLGQVMQEVSREVQDQLEQSLSIPPDTYVQNPEEEVVNVPEKETVSLTVEVSRETSSMLEEYVQMGMANHPSEAAEQLIAAGLRLTEPLIIAHLEHMTKLQHIRTQLTRIVKDGVLPDTSDFM